MIVGSGVSVWESRNRQPARRSGRAVILRSVSHSAPGSGRPGGGSKSTSMMSTSRGEAPVTSGALGFTAGTLPCGAPGVLGVGGRLLLGPARVDGVGVAPGRARRGVGVAVRSEGDTLLLVGAMLGRAGRALGTAVARTTEVRVGLAARPGR